MRGLGFISAREGLLTVLKEAHGAFAFVTNVATAKGSRTLAVDAKSGHVFLPGAYFEVKAVPSAGAAPLPTVVPGSFLVLVVGK